MRLGTAIPFTPDFLGFWEAVAELFPDVYSREDIHFLAPYGSAGANALRWQIEIWGAEDSPVLRRITILAHAYK